MAFKKAKETDKSLTKTQMVGMLAEATGLAKKDVAALLANLANLACAQASAASGCTIPGLGKLKLVKRNARMGRNPATGETIRIPAKKVVKFVVAKAAKDAIVPPKK
ncbi:MAG TPA: HU family DNA-binding protein [Candidatus Hydrogenedentes bacterium]|nr:HU family DNA-binding protein [Candidatus Hydrogenedentota bacterium]